MALIPLNPTEENNEISWYKAGAAGVASGLLKVPEGIFSLAAELIDLGFLAFPAGATIIRLLPPLIISYEEIDFVIDSLSQVLK